MASQWSKVPAENLIRYGETYYLNAKVAGKKIRVSLNVTTLKAAKVARDEKLAALRATSGDAAKGLKTLKDALRLLKARETTKPHLKPRSTTYYVEIFNLIEKTIPLNTPLPLVTKDSLATWWKKLAVKKPGVKRGATQCNNCLRMVVKAMEMAVEAGLRRDNPALSIRRLRPKKSAVEKLPSKEQFSQILAHVRAAHPRNKHAAEIIEFLAWSGLRRGELQALRWGDVGDEWLTVTGGEAGTKSGHTRMVPINSRLRGVIDGMARGNPESGVIRRKSARDALGNACKAIGVTRMRIHDLRHLFATSCVEAGVDVPTVAKWLGHQDGGILAMKTYGHLRDEHSLAQAKKLG